MNLYLVEVGLLNQPYMDEATSSKVMRLVWAMSEEEAERKVRLAYEKEDPYGSSAEVSWISVSAAIL